MPLTDGTLVRAELEAEGAKWAVRRERLETAYKHAFEICVLFPSDGKYEYKVLAGIRALIQAEGMRVPLGSRGDFDRFLTKKHKKRINKLNTEAGWPPYLPSDDEASSGSDTVEPAGAAAGPAGAQASTGGTVGNAWAMQGQRGNVGYSHFPRAMPQARTLGPGSDPQRREFLRFIYGWAFISLVANLHETDTHDVNDVSYSCFETIREMMYEEGMLVPRVYRHDFEIELDSTMKARIDRYNAEAGHDYESGYSAESDSDDERADAEPTSTSGARPARAAERSRSREYCF